MSRRSRDNLTRELFPPELEPGFSLDEKGNIVDNKGNIYDQDYNLIKEAPRPPSEGLLRARELHPDWTDKELAPLARIYDRQIEGAKKNKDKKK